MPQQSTSAIVDEIHTALLAHARSDVDQTFLQKYKGSPRTMLMVRMPEMRALEKRTRKAHKDLPLEEWIAVLDALYTSDVFEERILAGYFLANNKALRQGVSLAQLERWIHDLAGWNEIDNTCQSTWSGEEMLARWEEWQSFLQRANQSPNISLRRASLVLLCKPVRTSADARLATQAFANIERVQSEKPILITKAVSWLLRDLTTNHRTQVAAYLDANAATLPAIALRETRAKLATGKKS